MLERRPASCLHHQCDRGSVASAGVHQQHAWSVQLEIYCHGDGCHSAISWHHNPTEAIWCNQETMVSAQHTLRAGTFHYSPSGKNTYIATQAQREITYGHQADCSFFTNMAWCQICKYKIWFCHTWLRMSLLRPGVIKQHKTQLQTFDMRFMAKIQTACMSNLSDQCRRWWMLITAKVNMDWHYPMPPQQWWVPPGGCLVAQAYIKP